MGTAIGDAMVEMGSLAGQAANDRAAYHTEANRSRDAERASGTRPMARGFNQGSVTRNSTRKGKMAGKF